VNTLLQLFSILFPVAGFLLIVAGGLLLLARAHEEAEGDEMKKMSPKTFREFAELSFKNYRQRIEREEAEA